MSDSFSNYMGIHGTALGIRERRMQVLASNLANADTPNYRAQDLDFQSTLRATLASGREDAPGTALQIALHDRPSSQPSMDGNTVDGDREKAAYGQAALEYRASLTFLESKVRSMLTAITGQ